jgi:hypothetical protein
MPPRVEGLKAIRLRRVTLKMIPENSSDHFHQIGCRIAVT